MLAPPSSAWSVAGSDDRPHPRREIRTKEPAMRRLILVLAIAVGTVAAAAHIPGASIHAQSPTITVTPGNGSLTDTFTVVGSGFEPGTQLAEAYAAPDGTTYTFYIGSDPAVVVVGDDGTFTV